VSTSSAFVYACNWHVNAGTGKTSLLCALAGKASYGRVTGKVYVNGHLDQLKRYKKARLDHRQASSCLQQIVHC
jgi:ABC-type lipoprotein export system ATPase subunit